MLETQLHSIIIVSQRLISRDTIQGQSSRTDIIPRRKNITNASSIIATLEHYADELKRLGIIEIGLFGSWVNGKPRRRSDVDILVEFAPGMTTFDNYMDAKFFLKKIFHRKIDLVIKSAIKAALQSRILEDTRYATIS